MKSIFGGPLEKIIEQIIWIMIFYISINEDNTLVHFAQNISWRGGSNFNETFTYEEFANLRDGFLFNHERLSSNIIANCAIW